MDAGRQSADSASAAKIKFTGMERMGQRGIWEPIQGFALLKMTQYS